MKTQLFAMQDDTAWPAALLQELQQVAAWAARQNGVKPPEVKLFILHERAELHAACLRTGTPSYELQLPGPCLGFFQAGERAIWLRTDHVLAAPASEIVDTILHETRHYAKEWLVRADRVLSEEDAVGWTYLNKKQYAADMAEQARREREERIRRLAQVRAEIDKPTPAELRRQEAERALAERNRQAEAEREDEEARRLAGEAADYRLRWMVAQGYNPFR